MLETNTHIRIRISQPDKLRLCSEPILCLSPHFADLTSHATVLQSLLVLLRYTSNIFAVLRQQLTTVRRHLGFLSVGLAVHSCCSSATSVVLRKAVLSYEQRQASFEALIIVLTILRS